MRRYLIIHKINEMLLNRMNLSTIEHRADKLNVEMLSGRKRKENGYEVLSKLGLKSYIVIWVKITYHYTSSLK